MRTMEEVVEEVRSFPKVSPAGWLADDPDLADQLEKITAETRARGRARGFDDESWPET